MNKFFRKYGIVLILFFLFIAWAIYSYSSGGIVSLIANGDPQKVVDFVDSFGIFAAFIFVFVVVLEVILAPIPPLVLYIAGGLLFGGFIGGVLTLLGNLIGAFVDFRIARHIGKDFVERKTNPKLKKKFDKFLEKYGVLSLFLLRINPLTTSDLFSYFAGLTKMKASKFLLATGLGLIPMIFIQTYFGEIFIANNPILVLITLILSVLYFGVLVYFILYSFLKK